MGDRRQREIVRKNETQLTESAPSTAATESVPGPIPTEPTTDAPVRQLVVVDYADPPKTETQPVTDPVPVPEQTQQARAPKTESKPDRVKTSTVPNPVKFVWALAEEMRAADPNVTRKAIVDACIAKGVAFYTAKTQVQRFLKAKKTTP